MKKWNLIVDLDNCTNCNGCVLACHDEHVDNDFPGYAAPMPKHGHSWIEIRQKVRGKTPHVDVAYLPVMCQHCDDAPCMKSAKNGAVTKRADGIVIIDPVKSKGQKELVEACPYGAIWWNEDLQIPQHWIFDAHLLDQGWTEPRAQQSCATGAITAVKVTDEEMRAMASARGLEHLHPEFGTKPRVWYANLHRYNSAFIAGSVEVTVKGVTDCVEGARIVLNKDGKEVQSTVSDVYGDFKIDRLPVESGAYTVEISHEKAGSKSLDVELKESVYLGDISL